MENLTIRSPLFVELHSDAVKLHAFGHVLFYLPWSNYMEMQGW
jgi:hypothetical protein